MKNGDKNRSVAFIILFSVHVLASFKSHSVNEITQN